MQSVKWFYVLLFNSNYFIQHYSLICTQSNGFKYCYVTISHQLFICTHLNGYTYESEWIWEEWQWKGTPYSPKLQDCSLSIEWFNLNISDTRLLFQITGVINKDGQVTLFPISFCFFSFEDLNLGFGSFDLLLLLLLLFTH